MKKRNHVWFIAKKYNYTVGLFLQKNSDELCYQATVNEICYMHIFDNKDMFDKVKKQLKGA